MLPCVCSVIDHRWRQNVVRTKKWHTRRSELIGCYAEQRIVIGSNSKFKKTWIERCRHLCVCPLIDHRREPIRMRELCKLPWAVEDWFSQWPIRSAEWWYQVNIKPTKSSMSDRVISGIRRKLNCFDSYDSDSNKVAKPLKTLILRFSLNLERSYDKWKSSFIPHRFSSFLNGKSQ